MTVDQGVDRVDDRVPTSPGISLQAGDAGEACAPGVDVSAESDQNLPLG